MSECEQVGEWSEVRASGCAVQVAVRGAVQVCPCACGNAGGLACAVRRRVLVKMVPRGTLSRLGVWAVGLWAHTHGLRAARASALGFSPGFLVPIPTNPAQPGRLRRAGPEVPAQVKTKGPTLLPGAENVIARGEKAGFGLAIE